MLGLKLIHVSESGPRPRCKMNDVNPKSKPTSNRHRFARGGTKQPIAIIITLTVVHSQIPEIFYTAYNQQSTQW